MSRVDKKDPPRTIQIYIKTSIIDAIDKECEISGSGRGVVIEKAWNKLNAMIEKYESK